MLRNDNLFEQVKALFKNWLMSYKPFSIENWRTGVIGKIFEYHDSKRIPLSESGRDQIEMSYPYYDAT